MLGRQLIFIFSWVLIASAEAAPTKSGAECKTETSVEKQASDLLKVAEKAAGCPNKSKLSNLCNAVSFMRKDSDPDSSYMWEYQRIIYEASCVDYETASDEEIRKKVNAMWDKYEKELRCAANDFDVSNGSILKYAISKQFREFIAEAAQVWKVNLNRVDSQDGRTVLDYLEDEIKAHKGGPSEPILRQYEKVLRKAGAKRKSEL
jgi:hypothetical protein